MVKDFSYFADAFFDGITRERNVSDWRAQQIKAGNGGARNSAVQGVNRVDMRREVVSAPDGGFGGIEVEAM